MTGPKVRVANRQDFLMPNKSVAQKSPGQFADTITRLLTMARDADVFLAARMDDEVFRILGVRYKLPE